MLAFHTPNPLLIELHFTLHWSTAKASPDRPSSHLRSQKFKPTTFAANLRTDPDDGPELFLQSLDAACLARIRRVMRYTAYHFEKPIDYEVERAFVWTALGEVSMRGLSQEELDAQIRMVGLRGWRDVVRVEMAVEIEGGEELREKMG